MLTRRHLMVAATGIAATALVPRIAAAQTATPASGPFQLLPLPYPTNALEPSIDARTMEIHHDRHHGTYVNNLNNVAKEYPQIATPPIQDVLAKLGEVPETVRTMVRNNLGGHANHTMFWQVMAAGGGK